MKTIETGMLTNDSLPDSANAVLVVFQEQPSARLSIPDIRGALHESLIDLSDTVDDLVARGLLWRAGSGRYALPGELGIFSGTVRGRPSGGALVLTGEERFEVQPDELGGALDGDTVMVRRLGRKDRDGKIYGSIELILMRARNGISGVTRRYGKGWNLDPVNPVLPRGIRLTLTPDLRSSMEAGRIVFARLDYSGSDYTAVALSDMGSPSSPTALIDSVAADHGLESKFPDDVLEAAALSASEPIQCTDRDDLRGVFTITVDPVDARDFDDAISLERDGDGYILQVHIADVAAYAVQGGAVDLEARTRGTSVYLPDRVIPMIPEVLSAGACSLRPGEERLARTVVMHFDGQGERTEFTVGASVILSDARLSYEEALEYMQEGGPDPELRELLLLCGELSAILDTRRADRGALDIGGSEFRVHFGEEGWPSSFIRESGDISHRMIENFMVEANRAVADHCTWSDLPVLYRVHDDPVPESEQTLASRLAEIGIQLPGGRVRDPSVLREAFDRLAGSPLEDLLREAVLRSLSKAIYSPSNIGHFGLALRSYMHFTSPIRRYPDLLVHQVLAMVEEGRIPTASGDINSLADSCSRTERNAEGAERDAMELMAIVWLSRHIGENFPGVVSGIKRFGIFVRFDDLPLEGLAPAAEIRKAGISFGEAGGPFREGSIVEVRVVSVDVLERRVTLSPVGRPTRGPAESE